jgi:type IV pilus assembly protein PilB
MENNDYLDFEEAVLFLKTTPSTLYKWLQAGKIPGHKLGRQWRFLKDELEIHVSGKGPRIQIQKDFLKLNELLTKRSNKGANKMDIKMSSISEAIIWDAFEHGSRLIHIYPSKGANEIAYRAKGGIEILTSIQEESFQELDQYMKNNSTQIEENSRRIYLHRSDEEILQVKYQKIETVTGPHLTLRLWQTQKDILPLEGISNGDSPVLQKFKSWIQFKKGLFIVTGATGSGKTTTMLSLINEFKNAGRMVFTIEETAEFVIEGVNQVEIKNKNRETFEEIFEKVYSSDPDVICLGLGSYFGIEEKVFNAAFRAASTGHVVVIQMDQPNCEEAIKVFKKFCKYPIEQVLSGVSCQKLVEENGKVKAEYAFSDLI